MVVPALLLGIAVSCGRSHGTESTAPLQFAIDELVEDAAVGPLAPRCSDADFVRRIHLDLAGVIPTASQVRAFLADSSPHKRARLIEELLSGPAFARHMMFLLDAMLLERARPPGDLAAAWQEYLFATLDEDRPLDELARALLVSDGGDASTRAASSFLLTRQAEPVQLTRAIGRLYFGRDLQCAQCHDHPLDDDIRQEEYQGLYAFVARTSLFKGKGNQLFVSEKADGEVDYQSVFTQEGEKGVWPRLPGGTTVIAEPRPEPPAAYVEQPSKTSRGVPAFSRRLALAERLADHEGFRRNLANRIWAMFFGVGLVHPLDRVGPDNPPAHPALLTLLADALVDQGFRLRPLVRGIVLSETYQRSIDPPRPHDVDHASVLQLIAGLERQRDACNDTATARGQAAQEADACCREAAAAARIEHVKRLELIAARDQALVASAAAAAAAAKAGAAFDRIRKTSDPLAAAARHVARAADLVAGDEPLAVLSRTLADQVRRTTAATAEASRSLDDARAAATSAAAALVATRGSVATVTSRLGADSLTSLERAAVAARTAATEARHDVDNLDARLALARDLAAHAELRDADPSAADVAWQTIVERWTRAGQVAPMRPLTAEQLALSVQQATGALAARHASAVAAVDKASPESPAGSGDDDRDEIRAMQVEMRMVKDAADLLRSTASLFGDAMSEGFQASVNQALYFGNAPDIQGQLAPAGTNLVAALGGLDDPASVAEEAYVAVLSRPPSKDERADVAAFLAPRSQDRPQAIGELVWALISSNEFRFNH